MIQKRTGVRKVTSRPGINARIITEVFIFTFKSMHMIQQRQAHIINKTGRLEGTGSILHRTRSRIKLPPVFFSTTLRPATTRQQTESGSKQFTVGTLQAGRTQEDLNSYFGLHCSGCAILGSRWCQEYRHTDCWLGKIRPCRRYGR